MVEKTDWLDDFLMILSRNIYFFAWFVIWLYRSSMILYIFGWFWKCTMWKSIFNFIKLLYFINLINATAICYSFLCLSLEQIYDLSFPVPLLHYIKFNHQIIILFATNLISLISLIFINLHWHFEKKKKKKFIVLHTPVLHF